MAHSLRFTFAAALVLYLGMLLTFSEGSHRQDLNKAGQEVNVLNGTDYFKIILKRNNPNINETDISAYCNVADTLDSPESYDNNLLFSVQEKIYDEYSGDVNEKNKFVYVEVSKLSRNVNKKDDVAHRQ